MADDDEKVVPGRSAAYPFIPLEKALERAEQLRKAVGRNDTRVASAKSHWGYGAKSSGGIQTIAALRHFGLLEGIGSGADKRVKLSESALRILLDQRPDSNERRELIRKAALTPKMHAEMWNRWHNELPVDTEIRHYLILDRKFNENGADDLIAEYKATLGFAGLLEAGNMSFEAPGITENPSVRPGGQMEPAHADVRIETLPPGVTVQRRKVQDINVVQKGDRLQISATVDLEGIEQLKKMLDAYAEAMKLYS